MQKDQDDLARAALESAPRRAKLHNLLGKALHRTAQVDAALDHGVVEGELASAGIAGYQHQPSGSRRPLPDRG